jgi:hypothetical protein
MRLISIMLCGCFALPAAMTSVMANAEAQNANVPRLHTNEAYIDGVTATSVLAIGDPMKVFAYVIDSLPARVKVYPTENHFYFSFFHSGVRYAGNIKIDARLREQGKVRFSYYADQPDGLGDGQDHELILDATRGVAVEKVGPLAYRLTYKDKSVVFALNDLAKVRPPPQALAPDEQFIGPVFDESGVRFFLLFNAKLKIFLYVLDETVAPADDFAPAKVGDGRILIGRRTAFALYRDDRRDRKILIGVNDANVAANNYFDGPFDQMPDNFIAGDSFRQAVLAAEPDLKGNIDRYGALSDSARIVIAPYMQYRRPADLAIFRACTTSKRVAPASYYRCLALPLESDHGPNARPLALSPKIK